MSTRRPPLPPFSFETAVQKIRQAEDAWNTRDPERVALAGDARKEIGTNGVAIAADVTKSAELDAVFQTCARSTVGLTSSMPWIPRAA